MEPAIGIDGGYGRDMTKDTLPAFATRYLPHRAHPGWLGDEMADALLAYAVHNQSRFKPSRVRAASGPVVDPAQRKSLRLVDLGPFADLLRERALTAAPELNRLFGGGVLTPQQVEIELVAHGDGAFFTRHKDTLMSTGLEALPRRVTMVYYFHRRPKAFSGGQLRYYSLAGEAYFDIEPDHDVMVSFPSWAPHSVERISCPSDDFADQRFAIDMWILG